MAKILIPQKNLELDVQDGSILMEVLLANNLPVASSCGGDGVCGKCRIEIREGLESLDPPSEREIQIKNRHKIDDTQRVSCQTRVTTDLTLSTPYW